jgi:hypothetical protein
MERKTISVLRFTEKSNPSKEVQTFQTAENIDIQSDYSKEDINDEEKRIEEYNSLSNILSWSSSNHLIIH